MKKEVKIWEDRLEIEKCSTFYIISDTDVDIMLHASKLEISESSTDFGWLFLFASDHAYIGSIWLSTDTDIKTVKQFLRETK